MTKRISSPTLGVNPGKPVEFTYGSRQMQGCEGDTIATALFAQGIRIFSRSLKYHRPRGLFSLDGESSNTMMEVNGIPNVRTETCLLHAGAEVHPQNSFGMPEIDAYGILNYFSFMMPAGFYYRWFHRPYSMWPYFLKRIRKMAGMGKLPVKKDYPGIRELYVNGDICVIGGGPAGMAAALCAAKTGLKVVLFEKRPWLGGFYHWQTNEYSGNTPLYERAGQLAKEVYEAENIRVFTGAAVTGIWGDAHVTAVESSREGDFSERYIEMRAKAVIAATGAAERPLLFENNDRPGVMLPATAWRLARTYGILPGTNAVFSVGDDAGLMAAADLFDLGLNVLAVCDARTESRDPEPVKALSDRNIPFFPGFCAKKALGGKLVKGVLLTSLAGDRPLEMECDLIAASCGPAPKTELLSVAGASLSFDPLTASYLPEELPEKIYAAGRVTGLADPMSIEASGTQAGFAAAFFLGADCENEKNAAIAETASGKGPQKGCTLVHAPLSDKGAKNFVCFDEDATVKHIMQSIADGFDLPELAKRYSAAGTGPGQGGIPGHNLPLLMQKLRKEADAPGPPRLVPTNVRPPVEPVLFNTLAGHGHQIYKETPLHEEQKKQGAVFRRIGVWKRARYFTQDHSTTKEIHAVRSQVGMIDVSTLGKFRIFGKDAVRALDRVYISDMETVKPGRMKYSAMLNDDGCLLDDGVVTKTGENDYYFTTSTGRAGQTIEWIRYHTKEEGWDFHLVNLTDTLAAINLAGPRARDLLLQFTDQDITNEAFPYMGYRELTLMGEIPARVMRVGFVGELSYEMHIPASYAADLWRAFLEKGKEYGITVFGLEAQNRLRMEKGHVIIGQESEIRTNLLDLGMGWLFCRTKPGTKKVGAPSLLFSENQKDRLRLVGVEMETPEPVPGDGSLITDTDIRGHIATIRYSETLEKTIGMALVEEKLSSPGTTFPVYTGKDEEKLRAKVVKMPFYDPDGKRLRA